MNKIKNQRGFATLETLLILSTLAIFATVTIPKMDQILDKVALNYEMKHFYSEFELARSIGKSATFNVGTFPDMQNSRHSVELWLYSRNYGNDSARNRYQIMRTSLTSSPYYRHNLYNGINIEGNTSVLKIDLSKLGNSKTITLKSRFNDETHVVIDSVGRFHGRY